MKTWGEQPPMWRGPCMPTRPRGGEEPACLTMCRRMWVERSGVPRHVPAHAGGGEWWTGGASTKSVHVCWPPITFGGLPCDPALPHRINMHQVGAAPPPPHPSRMPAQARTLWHVTRATQPRMHQVDAQTGLPGEAPRGHSKRWGTMCEEGSGGGGASTWWMHVCGAPNTCGGVRACRALRLTRGWGEERDARFCKGSGQTPHV